MRAGSSHPASTPGLLPLRGKPRERGEKEGRAPLTRRQRRAYYRCAASPVNGAKSSGERWPLSHPASTPGLLPLRGKPRERGWQVHHGG
jgi:hypothetical protein